MKVSWLHIGCDFPDASDEFARDNYAKVVHPLSTRAELILGEPSNLIDLDVLTAE